MVIDLRKDGVPHWKVDSLAKMRLVTHSPGTIIVTDGRFGSNYFKKVASGTENGGTIFVLDNGDSYKLEYEGAVNAKWFGVQANGVDSDSYYVISADNEADRLGKPLYLPLVTKGYSYLFDTDWYVKSKVVYGDGSLSSSDNSGTVLKFINNKGMVVNQGYYSDISGFTIKNYSESDSATGLTISNSPLSKFSDIRIFGFETGIKIITNLGNNIRSSSWSLKFKNIQVNGCRYGLLTDGNEVNDFNVDGCTFNGQLGWSAAAPTNVWYGDNPNLPSYGILVDCSLNADNSSEISIGGWSINRTNLERHIYGTGFYLIAKHINSSPTPIIKDAVNIRNLHISNIYAEKCKDTIIIDVQEKGRCYGLSIENINSATDGLSIVRLLGSSGTQNFFGFFIGTNIDSKTINPSHSLPSDPSWQRINVDGIGKSIGNKEFSIGGEVLTIPLIVNSNDAIIGDGVNGTYANIQMAGGLLLKAGYSHRIVSMSISSDVQITSGADKALAITPSNFITSYHRDDYSTTDVVVEDITERFIQINAIDSQIQESVNNQGMTLYNGFTGQINTASTAARNIMRFTDIKDTDYINDRVFNFDSGFMIRKNGSTLPLQNKVFGYVVVEVWDNK